ncbi:MAG: hypothetical protein LCH32_12795 [Bacteroidetes bacterium]|nr:hypothetical protein [Bacteroidota bacterium]
MINNLINLVKEHACDAIINNSAIPNEKNNEAISSTANSIFDTLKNQAIGGNLNNVIGMFNNSSTNLNSTISNNVVTDLMQKFNLDNTQANQIAGSLIPKVLDNLVKKTNDSNDNSFDLQDILKNIGGSNSGIGGLLGNLFK